MPYACAVDDLAVAYSHRGEFGEVRIEPHVMRRAREVDEQALIWRRTPGQALRFRCDSPLTLAPRRLEDSCEQSKARVSQDGRMMRSSCACECIGQRGTAI